MPGTRHAAWASSRTRLIRVHWCSFVVLKRTHRAFLSRNSTKEFHGWARIRLDSRKSGIVAADVRRLTLKKANGTEPPYVGCYEFLSRPCTLSVKDISV